MNGCVKIPDVESILAAINQGRSKKKLSKKRQTQLVSRLKEIAIAFLQDYGAEQRDSPSAVLKQLNAIARHAEKLHRDLDSQKNPGAIACLTAQAAYCRENFRVGAVSLNSKSELEERIEPTTYPALSEVRMAVEAIELYAKRALGRERIRVKSPTEKTRYKGNRARQKWVNDLAGLWVDIFGELPGTSVNPETQKPGGPFIRFVLACYEPLKREFPQLPELTEEAARAHYRKTGEAKLKQICESTMAKSGRKKD